MSRRSSTLDLRSGYGPRLVPLPEAAAPDFVLGEYAPGCAGTDPEVFYPAGDHDSSYNAARAVCLRCALVVECGDWAIETGQPWGMWGAMTPIQRRRERERRGLPPQELMDDAA